MKGRHWGGSQRTGTSWPQRPKGTSQRFCLRTFTFPGYLSSLLQLSTHLSGTGDFLDLPGCSVSEDWKVRSDTSQQQRSTQWAAGLQAASMQVVYFWGRLLEWPCWCGPQQPALQGFRFHQYLCFTQPVHLLSIRTLIIIFPLQLKEIHGITSRLSTLGSEFSEENLTMENFPVWSAFPAQSFLFQNQFQSHFFPFHKPFPLSLFPA